MMAKTVEFCGIPFVESAKATGGNFMLATDCHAITSVDGRLTEYRREEMTAAEWLKLQRDWMPEFPKWMEG